jgi:hypothetical protein
MLVWVGTGPLVRPDIIEIIFGEFGGAADVIPSESTEKIMPSIAMASVSEFSRKANNGVQKYHE